MKEQRKKCAVKGCNKLATHKMHITIIYKNSGIKEGYMHLCKEHFLEGTKEVLSLRGKDARVDIKFLENGGAYLFAGNNILKRSTFVALTRNDIKWILYFILKNEAKFGAKV